jgi:hypothetical protein
VNSASVRSRSAIWPMLGSSAVSSCSSGEILRTCGVTRLRLFAVHMVTYMRIIQNMFYRTFYRQNSQQNIVRSYYSGGPAVDLFNVQTLRYTWTDYITCAVGRLSWFEHHLFFFSNLFYFVLLKLCIGRHIPKRIRVQGWDMCVEAAKHSSSN